MAEHANIYEALLAAQSAFPPVSRDAVGQAGPRRYQYATLLNVIEAVAPALHDHGITLTQPTVAGEHGELWLHTVLTHAASETHITGVIPLPAPVDWQQWGSAMTYARRYGLQALLGITPDDDDDAASAPRSSTTRTQDASEHGICSEHGVPYFMTSNMRSAAHRTDNGGWCNKPAEPHKPLWMTQQYSEAADVLAQLHGDADARMRYVQDVIGRTVEHPEQVTAEEWVKVKESAVQDLADNADYERQAALIDAEGAQA